MIGNWTQLNKMASNVSNHYLLLYHYDVQPTPVMHLGGCLLQPCQVCSGVESRAITVKTPLAITYNTVGEELSTIGYRLSEQIYLRFFRGLDLEFNPSLVSRVIKGTELQASFLVLANVVLGGSDLEQSINEFAQPFLNRYSRLSESSAGAS